MKITDEDRQRAGRRLSWYLKTDPDFTRIIEKIAPDWLIDTAVKNKKELLEIAERGEKRPSQKSHPLGKVLSHYLSPHSKCYDQEFRANIEASAPAWINPVARKKQLLLQMATAGGPKPPKSHELGIALRRYLRNDAGFRTAITVANKYWVDGNNKTYDDLLELAVNNKPRPSTKTKLGIALRNMSRNSKHTQFIITLKERRPDWWVGSGHCRITKNEILLLVSTADKKPTGNIWDSILNARGRDKAFAAKLDEKKPEWFLKSSTIMKRKLIELAKSGARKPFTTTKFGYSLTNYTNKNNRCYDPIFDAEIRRLRPDWFK